MRHESPDRDALPCRLQPSEVCRDGCIEIELPAFDQFHYRHTGKRFVIELTGKMVLVVTGSESSTFEMP
jgi:hypothetical protein